MNDELRNSIIRQLDGNGGNEKMDKFKSIFGPYAEFKEKMDIVYNDIDIEVAKTFDYLLDDFGSMKYQFNYAQLGKMFAEAYAGHSKGKRGGRKAEAYLSEIFGSDVDVFSFSARDGTSEDNFSVQENNVRVKKRFENAIDPLIGGSSRFGPCKRYKKITTDYDILGDESKNGATYSRIGKRNAMALRSAVNSGAGIEICMRVLEPDGSPYAVNTAKRLANLGDNVSIFNYDNGEKFGLIECGNGSKAVYTIYREFFPGWAKRVGKQAEVKQDHKKFVAVLFHNSPVIYDALDLHFEMIKEKKQFTKEMLSKY